ncbi:MAG: M1 family metallopeptidase [Saprospirales bacterium]|nr:M1 family metallopeptidase [Saprospirales bacterium]
MLRPERTCYDVTFYDLYVRVDPNRRWLEGWVYIHYQALEPFERLQIDLDRKMEIKSIQWNGLDLPYERLAGAVFITFPPQEKGSSGVFRVTYEGFPREAPNAPWQGGFVWAEDQYKKPWMGVACEGDGASLWWPNKDHLSDEPDSMKISVSVPNPLQCISNGNLRAKVPEKNNHTRYDWFVSYPINNYNVTLNIGNYTHFSETYRAEDGSEMPLDYYVLHYNIEKARRHFEQVAPTLACFEKYFGKYPFWDDGFALVEAPYLAMEHQSAIAYGNQYMRGYLGGMIPEDMNWDYAIVHESGHEYFGNSIGCSDLSEMWIHESFTTYMEALFVECRYGYADAVRYMNSQRGIILNKEPILGPKDVNWDHWKGGTDQYYKGAWMLHTLRHAIGDDEQWFALLRAFYDQYALQQIDTDTFVQFVNHYTGTDYSSFFEQYLWYPDIPVLVYKLEQRGKDVKVTYQWKASAPGFKMPVTLQGKDRRWRLNPESGKRKTSTLENCRVEDIRVSLELFLIGEKRL